MTGRIRRIVITGTMLALGIFGCASGPPVYPQFMIEAGMHTARLRSLALATDGSVFLTASDDKTARIWSTVTGTLEGILRPPIDHGEEGRLWAVALSPNGRTVATGGWTGPRWTDEAVVYLFDRSSGELRGRIVELPQVVLHLAFSPDGRYLAIALNDDAGVRVFRTSDLSGAMRDASYGDATPWLEFDQSGRMVTASVDGTVRLYSSKLKRVCSRSLQTSKRISAARFSADGQRIAVTYEDKAVVDVLSSNDLSPIAQLVSGQKSGGFTAVAWSSNGGLFAAGDVREPSGRLAVFSWSRIGERLSSSWSVSGASIAGLEVTKEGQLLVGTVDRGWSILDPSGNTKFARDSPCMSASTRNRLMVSNDASTAEIVPPKNAGRPIRFSVPGLTRQSPGRQAIQLEPPRDHGFASPEWSVEDWQESSRPRIANAPLWLFPGEKSHSLAIAPHGGSFVLGTDLGIRRYSQFGVGQGSWLTPSPVLNVNVSGDGEWVVAALADGTIRWYGYDDFDHERLAVFLSPDPDEWVAWTPEGLYAASPNGSQLGGYHINQPDWGTPEWISLDQLTKYFYRPDIVSRVLEPNIHQEIKAALRGLDDVHRILTAEPPPKVEIASARVANQVATLNLQLYDRGAGIADIRSRVNGVERIGRHESPRLGASGGLTLRYDLTEGTHTLTVTASNRRGTIDSTPAQTIVTVKSSNGTAKLHVLAIGVTDYKRRARLPFAREDAIEVADELQRDGVGLFESRGLNLVLKDAEVTHESLNKAFKDFATAVGPNDVFIFYAAGHGDVVDGKYVFFLGDRDEKGRDSINEQTLRDWLETIDAGRSLVLLDTCGAGTFSWAATERLTKTTGRSVISAASSNQEALEGYRGHGVFTYFLLQALGAADRNGDGKVDVGELADYVRAEVPRLAREKFSYDQYPATSLQGPAFSIARVPSAASSGHGPGAPLP